MNEVLEIGATLFPVTARTDSARLSEATARRSWRFRFDPRKFGIILTMNIDNTELLEALKLTQPSKPEKAAGGKMDVAQEVASKAEGLGA